MGILDSVLKIGGALAAPATGGLSLGLTGLATAADIGSTLMTNTANKKAATTAWDRSIGASNTGYQRTVQDMLAAGLNPILAYSQGPASTPTASTASVEPMPKAGSNALAAAATKAGLLNTAQSTATSRATEALTAEQARGKKLENDAFSTLPPWLRAFTMSGSTASAVGAGASKALSAGAIGAKYGTGFAGKFGSALRALGTVK